LPAPATELPKTFDARTSLGPSTANVPWREYFQDPRLVSLIDEGLRANTDLAMAVQRIERSRATVTLASGALLPKLDATLGLGVRKFGLYTMDGAGNATTDITPGRTVPVNLPDFALGVQSSWEADVWGKLRSQRDAAGAQLLASVEASHVVRTSLVAEIAGAWFELQALDRVREVLAATVTRQAEALQAVRVQKEAGRTSELAVQQFEAQLAETRALEVETLQQARTVEANLNVLLGRFPQPIERAGTLSFEPLPAVSAGLPSELLQMRPDIRQAEHELAAARFELIAARAAFFPSVNLSAGVGLQAFNPLYLVRIPDSLAYSLAGGLVAPLVNRSAIEAQFQGATAAQLEAMYGYQKVVLTAFAEASTSLAGLKAADELSSLKRTQRAALERSIATAELLFRAGKASYLEVLAAQQGALRADLELVEAWRKQRLASVTVYRALGGGWSEPTPKREKQAAPDQSSVPRSRTLATEK
jgi:NodT family efflux transporter outer membrane factor (OMF) lipoprotein